MLAHSYVHTIIEKYIWHVISLPMADGWRDEALDKESEIENK